MTECQRLVAGLEAAIAFSIERLDEAFEKVPPLHMHFYTTNYRHLLYAQLRFLTALGGKGGMPLCDVQPRRPLGKINFARLKL